MQQQKSYIFLTYLDVLQGLFLLVKICLIWLNLKYFNFVEKMCPTPSCESQSALSCSAGGESNCCSSGAEETFRLEVKVTEL